MKNIFDGISDVTITNIALTVLCVAAVLLIRRLVSRFILERVADPLHRYRWQKVLNMTGNGLIVLFVMGVWFDGVGSIATYLGLISAGLAVALKDPIVNLAGFAFIAWRGPFELDDRIEIAGVTGDVVDIRLFQFTLYEMKGWSDGEQPTGRLIHIPNGKVFVEIQKNYTQSFRHIWEEQLVLFTFESDWKKAKAIIQDILKNELFEPTPTLQKKYYEMSKKFLIQSQNLTPQTFTTVKDCGVAIGARYVVEPRERRKVAEYFWETLLTRLEQHPEIDFAYPTQRFFDHRTEGKPAVSSMPIGPDVSP